MASGSKKQDIDEMFLKMGEKLGWFKNSDRKPDQSRLTQDNKHFTPMKIKEENTGCKSTDGKKRNRLKLKKKSTKAFSASTEKTISTQSRFNITKPQSFQALLSSDSEEEQKVPLLNSNKANQPKDILCSDSDDDKPLPRSNKVHGSVTCVNESFLASDHSGKGLTGSSCRSECDYNDTIVQKRLSLASYTLDMDSLGEPLVESTRIHRRSSVTYRQIIETIGESDTSTKFDNHRKDDKNDTKIDDPIDDSVLVCDETKFVTAIENFEALRLSPEPMLKTELQSYKEGDIDESNDENKDETDHSAISNKNETDSSEISNNLSGHKSFEEVEVVDTGTQTEDVPGIDEEGRTQTEVVPGIDTDCFTVGSTICGSKPNNVYAEETVADGKAFHDNHLSVNNLYEEETVRDHSDIGQSKSDSYSESTEIVSDMNNYSGQTECSLREAEDEVSVYNDATESYDPQPVFDDVTDAGITDDKLVDVYQEDTVQVLEHLHENLAATSEDSNQRYLEIFADSENVSESETSDNVSNLDTSENASESVTSEYEVNDVGTQTDDANSELVSRHTERVEQTSELSDENSEHSIEITGEVEQGLPDSGDENNSEDGAMSEDQETEENGEEVESVGPLDESGSSGEESVNEVAKIVKPSKKNRNNSHEDAPKKVMEQSWRSRKDSDSSDSDALESFLQKMKGKPKPIESDSSSSSSVSMDDFIVEDDDMSSESDDDVFYLRETQKMNHSSDYNPGGSSSDNSDSESSEEEDNEAKSSDSEAHRSNRHKPVEKPAPASTRNIRHKPIEKMPASVSFSSDEDNNMVDNLPSITKKKTNKPKAYDPVDRKIKKKTNKLQQSRIDFGLSSDSDNDLVEFPEVFSAVKLSNKVVKHTDGDCDKTGNDWKGSVSSTNESELFKTPNPIRRKKVGSDKENQFKTPTSVKKMPIYTGLNSGTSVKESPTSVKKTPTSVKKISVSSKGYISISDNDSDSDSTDFVVTPSPSVRSISGTPKATHRVLTPVAIGNRKVDSISTPLRGSPTCTFLKSLSWNIDDDRRHPEARKFVKGFKKTKEELSAYLFTMFNKTVFDNKLPRDMSVTWNKRLLRTAGYCAYKKNVKNAEDRTARIELSTKVCDSAERTRDTLIHEMCHSAVWLLNGVNGGHGPFWKYWARHATRIHPELPSISRCHSYSINTKFTYRCKKCGYSLGRHSKSLDTKKKVCGYCRGEFELIQNSEPTTPSSASSSISTTPRQPNKFALFVKENYNSIKKRKQDLKHGDVMKELSKLFAESKITSK